MEKHNLTVGIYEDRSALRRGKVLKDLILNAQALRAAPGAPEDGEAVYEDHEGSRMLAFAGALRQAGPRRGVLV